MTWDSHEHLSIRLFIVLLSIIAYVQFEYIRSWDIQWYNI